MRKIKVSIERQNVLFEKVRNQLFHRTEKLWWKVEENGSIKAHSIMWLFCWACNGDTHWKAMTSCRDAFNEIFDFNFFQFLERVGYRFSEHYRYKPSDYLEKELDELLNKKCPKCQSENIFNLSYGSETSEEHYEMITEFGTADPLLVNPFNCKWRCKDCNNQF